MPIVSAHFRSLYNVTCVYVYNRKCEEERFCRVTFLLLKSSDKLLNVLFQSCARRTPLDDCVCGRSRTNAHPSTDQIVTITQYIIGPTTSLHSRE